MREVMSVKALENAKNSTAISYKENASPSHVADSYVMYRSCSILVIVLPKILIEVIHSVHTQNFWKN